MRTTYLEKAFPAPGSSHISIAVCGRVVDQLHLAGLLDIDDELRVLVRRHDGRHPGLRMLLGSVHRQPTDRHDLFRLERVAIHDHELGGQ